MIPTNHGSNNDHQQVEAIRELRTEAALFGDGGLFVLCERALDGDLEARASCLRIIAEEQERMAAANEQPKEQSR